MSAQWAVNDDPVTVLPWPEGMDQMDPLATLIVSLGTLLVLDLAALNLGGVRRPKNRVRATRSR